MALWTRRFATWSRSFEKMNSPNLAEVFLPPIKRDMLDLDRSFFKKTIPLSVATVFEKRDISKVRAELVKSGDILSIDGIRVTREDETAPGRKCILLKPAVDAAGMFSISAVMRMP
jgi:tRNA (guanine37-N1)-methyltransferase